MRNSISLADKDKLWEATRRLYGNNQESNYDKRHTNSSVREDGGSSSDEMGQTSEAKVSSCSK